MKKGLWLVLATACISGFSIFLNKFGIKGFDPAVFTTSKAVIVTLFLLAAVLAMREWKTLKELSTKTWAQLALIGLIGGSIPFLLFFTGLKITTAAQAGFLHKTMFIWITILAAVTLKERISKSMVIGGILLLLGNLFILKITGWNFGTGDLLILLATLFWSAEITLSKYVLTSLEALPGRIVALGRMGFGSLFLLIYLAATGKMTALTTFSGAQILWITITSVLLFSYVFTFYEGLKTVNASVAAAILLLGTVITTLLNLFWTQSIGLHQIVGGVLLIAGALLFVEVRLPAPQRARQ